MFSLCILDLDHTVVFTDTDALGLPDSEGNPSATLPSRDLLTDLFLLFPMFRPVCCQPEFECQGNFEERPLDF